MRKSCHNAFTFVAFFNFRQSVIFKIFIFSFAAVADTIKQETQVKKYEFTNNEMWSSNQKYIVVKLRQK